MAKTTTKIEYVEDKGAYKLYRRPVTRHGGILQLAPGQGADGYGNKIHTDYILQFDGQDRKYRVYAICISNVSSLYILIAGNQKLFIRTSWGQSEIPDEPK